MNTEEALEWLFGTQWFGIKLGLEAPERLLAEFEAMPKKGVTVIQVAGTNGKGSTSAMMESIARASGIRTGLFTSPHLVHYSERIRVNGERIGDAAIASGLTELKALVADWEDHPTFFELTLALAMRYFRQRECELIILECGMGGRLDATTAVPSDLSVITPIGMDHEKWLGDTLEKIAGEKAGIIRPNGSVISAPQAPEALQVIKTRANALRADFQLIDEPLEAYTPALAGEHQRWNAAVACAALHKVGISLREAALRQGLAQVSWPGRFERFQQGRVILDGAHNPHASRVLLETWQAEYPGEKATLIFGAVESKDIRGVLRDLCSVAARVYLVQVASSRGLPTAELLDACPDERPVLIETESLEAAYAAAQKNSERILVAGSLYLVGQMRALIEGVPFQVSDQ